ncbi:universal stress protein [Pontibacter rugosus]|uniref:Universal stress protein n=1 Tax=Pontibacter rugosus TaxID=1745966 RepID=A0ABW3SVD1_9BACT
MKKILVPIDYSENSQNVFAHALGIAQVAGADIVLLHAFFPVISPPAAYNVTSVTRALEEGKQHELEEFAANAKENIINQLSLEEATNLNQVNITCITKMGGSFEQVMHAIKTYKADLVVMGMQVGEAVSQALIGSTTISVIEESSVPVLAVPKGITYKRVTSVVFAAALHKLPATTDLHLLRDFIINFNAKLQVLHLYRTSDQFEKFEATEALEVLDRNFKDIEFEVNFDYRPDIAEGIQDFIKETKAELLILIPQKHNVLERLLDKSITGRLTAHPLVPVLTLPHGILQTSANTKEEAASI